MEQQKTSVASLIHRLDISIGRILKPGEADASCQELSHCNGRIIHFLTKHEGEIICQKELEAEFGFTRSTASRVLNLMEQKGLIERRTVPGDARLKQVLLTERGRSTNENMKELFARMENKLLSGFSEEEVALLVSYIDRLQQNLTEQRSECESC